MTKVEVSITTSYRLWDGVKRHGDLVSSVAIVALNSMVLAAKLCVAVPVAAGRAAQAALAYVGVISIPAQGRYLGKTFYDLRCVLGDSDTAAMAATAVKVANQASDIFLTFGGFVASVASLLHRRHVTLMLYGVMRPWGVVGTMLAVALDVYEFYCNSKLVARLEVLSRCNAADRHAAKLSQGLLGAQDADDGDAALCHPELHRHLPSLVVRNLDVDTWDTLRQRLRDKKHHTHLLGVVKEYGQNKQRIAQASLGIKTLGYLAMGLCRAYPDTLVQGAVCLAMSALYTSKLAYKKLCEGNTRSALTVPQV